MVALSQSYGKVEFCGVWDAAQEYYLNTTTFDKTPMVSVSNSYYIAIGQPVKGTSPASDTTNWVDVTGGGGGGGGTVTTLSVVTANGFAGTVANATTTPAITLTTSVTGLLQGNGTAISAVTPVNNAVLVTNGSGVASYTTLLPATVNSGSTAVTNPVTSSLTTLDTALSAIHGATGGTVTTVSVATANGFAGTVANATTTPAITVTTSATGVLVGNGTAISGITPVNNAVLITNGSGVASWVEDIPAANFQLNATTAVVDGSGAALSITINAGNNTIQTGGECYLYLSVTYPVTASPAVASLTGIPLDALFPTPLSLVSTTTVSATGGSGYVALLTGAAFTFVTPLDPNSPLLNSELSGKTIIISGTYRFQ